jgi:hypothetical protein
MQAEAKLDGIHILRTSESKARLPAADTVRGYRKPSEGERAFQCLKGIDLLVRPIHHRDEQRVEAHIFCSAGLLPGMGYAQGLGVPAV